MINFLWELNVNVVTVCVVPLFRIGYVYVRTHELTMKQYVYRSRVVFKRMIIIDYEQLIR